MGWENRDYYSRSEPNRGSYYLANPAAILAYSLSLGSYFNIRVRLHFWLLLSFLLLFVDSAERHNLRLFPLAAAIVLLALLLHELGHRFVARAVGGAHDEFVLWPSGGMVPPSAPPRPLPMFLANVAGPAVNLSLAILSAAALYALTRHFHLPLLLPLGSFSSANLSTLALDWTSCLWAFYVLNLAIFIDSLLPYEWFDGARVWESILWPITGLHRAINITCIAGMVLAVPLFLLGLRGGDFLWMAVWALLFASAYVRRKQLLAEGTDQLEAEFAFASTQAPVRGSRRGRWSSAARAAKKAAHERKVQQKIDAILAKVSETGMQSLNFRERRALRKATQHQRQRDR